MIIAKHINFHNIDIKDFKKLSNVINKYKIDVCIHLAAQVDVTIAKDKPFETFESNIRGTYNLLEILRTHKYIKSIIVASSDKAYGEYKISICHIKKHMIYVHCILMMYQKHLVI